MNKVAHLGTVTLDTKLANTKQLSADEILANGEDVAEMFNREHTYRELTSRVKLEPEDNYILYGDDGKVVSANLSGVTNGTRLFYNQTKLTEISLSWKLDSITDGTNMCNSCTKLTTFLHPLTNLTNGSNMFYGCNLDEKSVENILTTIPEYASGSHALTMYINVEAVVKFNEITGNSLPLSSTVQVVPYKGWEITVVVMGLPSNYKVVPYIESSGTQYIHPDLTIAKLSVESKWECSDNLPPISEHISKHWGCYASVENRLQHYPSKTGNRYAHNVTSGSNMLSTTSDGLTVDKLDYNNKAITVNGVTTKGGFDYTNDLYTIAIFACNQYNGEPAQHTYAKCYYFKAWKNYELVRNFIPCVDDINEPGLYDLVNKQMYTSLGESLLAPTETTTYSLRRPVATFAQKTPYGIRRLYHVPGGYEGSEEDYAQEFGFKQLVENERPEEGNWAPKWEETNNELILNWIEVEEEMTDV